MQKRNQKLQNAIARIGFPAAADYLEDSVTMQVNRREAIGTRWTQVDPGGSRWIQVDPGGNRWIQVDPGGNRWKQVGPVGSRWIQVDPGGWGGTRGFGFKRFQDLRLVDYCPASDDYQCVVMMT